MKAYFVRHGKTNYNELRLCNADPTVDVHLTAKGIEQAEHIRDRLKGIELDVIYVSNLPRTHETAKIINEYHNVQFIEDIRLTDRLTGMEDKKVIAFRRAIAYDRINGKVNGGESWTEEKERVHDFLNYLKKQEHDNVLVVTSNDPMRVIKGYFEKLNDKQMLALKIPNCCMLKYEL